MATYHRLSGRQRETTSTGRVPGPPYALMMPVVCHHAEGPRRLAYRLLTFTTSLSERRTVMDPHADLAQAEQYIIAAEKRIARQRNVIIELRGGHHDATEAEEV